MTSLTSIERKSTLAGRRRRPRAGRRASGRRRRRGRPCRAAPPWRSSPCRTCRGLAVARERRLGLCDLALLRRHLAGERRGLLALGREEEEPVHAERRRPRRRRRGGACWSASLGLRGRSRRTFRWSARARRRSARGWRRESAVRRGRGRRAGGGAGGAAAGAAGSAAAAASPSKKTRTSKSAGSAPSLPSQPVERRARRDESDDRLPASAFLVVSDEAHAGHAVDGAQARHEAGDGRLVGRAARQLDRRDVERAAQGRRAAGACSRWSRRAP